MRQEGVNLLDYNNLFAFKKALLKNSTDIKKGQGFHVL